MAALILILKIIMWLILGILGLLLVILLTVLFVPITYRVDGAKHEAMALRGIVAWLFGIVRVQIEIVNKKTVFVVKLLWKTLSGTKDEQEEPEAKPEKEPVPKDKSSSEPMKTPEPAPPTTPKPEKESMQTKETPEEKTFDKVKDTIRFIRSPEQKGTLRVVLYRLKKILKSILPRRFNGSIRFGLEDPFVTGVLAGGASVFYPKYYRNLSIQADFDEPGFEGDFALRGRIVIGVIAYHGLRLYMDRRIRRIIKKFK